MKKYILLFVLSAATLLADEIPPYSSEFDALAEKPGCTGAHQRQHSGFRQVIDPEKRLCTKYKNHLRGERSICKIKSGKSKKRRTGKDSNLLFRFDG